MTERMNHGGNTPENYKRPTPPEQPRGGEVFDGRLGLTVRPETSYAKSGEIYPMEAGKEVPITEVKTPQIEVPYRGEAGVARDIVTRPTGSITDPEARAFAEGFEAETELSSIQDEDAWPTDKLKDKYREIHHLTSVDRLLAKAGLSDKMTHAEHSMVDLSPYSRLILNELKRRRVDVNPLLSEVSQASQDSDEATLRSRTSTPTSEEGNNNVGQRVREILPITPGASEAAQVQDAATREAEAFSGVPADLFDLAPIVEGTVPTEFIEQATAFREPYPQQSARNYDVRALGPTPGNPAGGPEISLKIPGVDEEDDVDAYVTAWNNRYKEYLENHPGVDNEFARSAFTTLIATGKSPERERAENQAESTNKSKKPEKDKKESDVTNLNSFLEEVIKNSDPKWGPEGEFSLVTENKEINQENFLRWIRDRMMYFHGESPNEAFNMFQKVRLQRYYKDITVNDMIENQEKYFMDDDGKLYEELAVQIRKEMWQFDYWRKANIEYGLMMGDDSKNAEVINKHFYYNDATRTVWGKSMLAHTLTLPEKFTSEPVKDDPLTGKREKPDQPPQDARVGIALNTAFLTYYNISDREKLIELLGEDAPLLQEDAIRNEILAQAKNAGTNPREFIQDTDELAWDILNAEKPTSQKDLMTFINIYNNPEKHSRIFDVVRELVKKSVQQKFENIDTGSSEEDAGKKLNDIDAGYAENFAYIMTRLMGAGWRNDLAANANDAGAKPGKLKAYRMKQAEAKRGGMIGNPYNIHMLKSLMVDFLNGTRTETWMPPELDENGEPKEGAPKKRYTPMAIMEAMEKEGMDSAKVQELSKKLIFPENTMRQYAGNHYARGFKIFHEVTEGSEIDWGKLTTFDPINGGIKFNRAGFEGEVKDKFFKTMRYAYATYNQLDFSQPVRTYTEKLGPNGRPVYKYNDKGVRTAAMEWRKEPLARAMFGYELLDVEYFHKLDEKHKPLKDEFGMNVIDYDKVNADKAKVWKQVALGRIAAELYAHRDWHSTDPQYDEHFYMHAVEALEAIPGNILGDEFDFHESKLGDSFFEHHDIQWLREKAKITSWQLYRKMLTREVFQGSAEGLKKAMKKFFGDVFK